VADERLPHAGPRALLRRNVLSSPRHARPARLRRHPHGPLARLGGEARRDRRARQEALRAHRARGNGRYACRGRAVGARGVSRRARAEHRPGRGRLRKNAQITPPQGYAPTPKRREPSRAPRTPTARARRANSSPGPRRRSRRSSVGRSAHAHAPGSA
jgi:hypothetical protein